MDLLLALYSLSFSSRPMDAKYYCTGFVMSDQYCQAHVRVVVPYPDKRKPVVRDSGRCRAAELIEKSERV